MGIEEQTAKIRKKIENIKRVLTDWAPLMLAQRTTKQNQIATLRAQLLALQAQLPTAGVKKIVHQ